MTRKSRLILLLSSVILLLLAGLSGGYFLLFSPYPENQTTHYIYIDKDDTVDSVANKVCAAAEIENATVLRFLMLRTNYGNNIRTGRYAISPEINVWDLFRNLRFGQQTPTRLTITTARTTQQLAGRLSRKLELDSATLASHLNDTAFCKKFGHTPATIICLFLPNTYEVYWDITPEQLVRRMQKESKAFWTEERTAKAEKAGLKPNEVITLASIINQETTNAEEKPRIAGLYINRLNKGMKLQACPTAKFAAGKYTARRVTNDIITANSPYNTYLYEGLPPGPICLPSITDIEAVLNYEKNDYLYMCAKEDFSGTHNFATNGAEHMRNARRYAAELNRRKIMK